MPISYKNKIYTTLGTPTILSGDVISTTNNVGVPAKDYTVKGKTVVWNQMMDKSKFRFGQTFEGITSVNNGDGSFTLSGTSTGYYEYVLLNPTSIPTVSSHKYLLRGCPPGGQWAKKWGLSGLNTDESTDVGDGVIITGTTSISPIMYVWSSAGAVSNLVFKPQLFNLTKMFGTGNEPATVAEFRAMFPDDYYSYNAGELKTIMPTSVEASDIERFQLLDKSKYQATTTINSVIFTNNGDGTITANGTADATVYYRLDNAISVSVGHKLLIVSGISGGSWGSYLLYDDENLDHDGFDVSGIGKIYTAGASPAALYIFIHKDYTANNLIFKPQLFDLTQMFGAGNEPATPAEFWQKIPEKLYGYNPSAYKSVNIPSSKYFPDGMRSAGSAYDEVNFLSQKATKRISAVDMGTLNWSYEPVASHERFLASVDGIKIASGSAKGNLVCSKYTTASVDDVYLHTADKIIAVHNAIEQVWVYDSSYTDASAFKAAMSGVMLYYELATPVETAITPSLQALSTYKGFTSFSAPNSLTQNGPLSVTYYAEGGNNPESGWLTSYKRKLYMGRNIEWNQLFDKNSTPSKNSDAITYSVDGNINILRTTSAITTSYFNFLCNTIANHKYMICAKSLEWNSPNHSNLFIGDSNYPDTASYAILTPSDLTKFFTATNETCYIKAYISYSAGNYEFKMNGLQFFDLTQMFGTGNEPATAAEFWSYFPNKVYPYNAGETQPLFKISRKSQWGSATAAASAARTITVQETSFAPAVSKLCSLRKVRGSFAGTPTLYTTANNANKIEVGNNGYEWVTKVNDDNQIVSGNDFLDAFGVSQTVDGTSLAGKTLGFMTKFSSRLSTTEGTDGGTFTSWGMSGEVEEIKSCEKEDLYCVVYNSETDTVKVYVLDEYDEQYGTFSVSAEIGYNTMIAFMLDTTEDEA